MRTGALRTAIAGALGALALAACGTTVPVTSQARMGEGLSPEQSLGGRPSTGATGGRALPGTAAPRGASQEGPASGGTGGSAVPLPSALPSGSDRGKLPPIQIGSYYLQGGNAALGAAGFAGLVIPDNKPLLDAMVAHLNKHGGLGGRQIQLVWFKYVSGGDPHTQDAAACQTFTQDHHVYLVLGGINSGAGELGPCLTKHGVPLIGANAGGDARYFAANHRYVYEPGQASFTRGLSQLVADLRAERWFAGDHRIGVVQYEGEVYDRAVDDGVVAPLARMGMTLTDRVKMSGVDNNSIAQGSANAVLKFSAKRIDRVIFMAPGGGAATYFMNAASAQQYQPLYGVWSADSPYVLGITAAKDQLANAQGIGYQPGLDVAGSQDPTASTPVARKCLAFWDSVGQTDHSALKGPLQRATCDVVWTLLRAVAAGPTTTLSTAALETGYDAIGSSYSPASTFTISFRPGSHDAAAGYRRLAYRSTCSCFVYLGPTRTLP